jgi:shikimate kinase
MLVAQAVAAQEIWNGIKISDTVIDKIYTDIKTERSDGRKNVVLIGMPGSGKTTVGEKVAGEIGYDFIDIDSMIEQKFGSIPSLFNRGEDYFRQCETACAKEAAGLKGAVIATGGGIVTRRENMKELSQTGTVFFLNRSLKNILSDIVQETRPLLKEGVEKLYELYDRRIDLYKDYADVTVDSDMELSQVVGYILTKVKEK